MSSLHIIYASTSGHTEFVVDTLIAFLQSKNASLQIEKQRAELAKPEDLLRGDILILAASSWNTGGPEGQLNPHMFALLMDRAAASDLGGKKVGLIGLGDDRYHFLVGAMDYLQEYVQTHNGRIVEPVLRIINEPYGQEKKVEAWGNAFLKAIN